MERAGPCLPFVTAVMTGSCVHLFYNSSWKPHQLAARQLLSGQRVQGTVRPLQCKLHLPGHCPPAKLAGRRVGPALHDNANYLA
jgi:hypothetical protein